MNSHNATDPEDDTRHLDSLTTMRPDEPRDEVDPPHPLAQPVETPSMPARAARPVSAIALTTALALSACGGGDEPPPKETTTSSTTDKKQSLSETAEEAYRAYWQLESVRPSSETPIPEQKSKMTDEAYRESADIAERSTPTKVVGRDKLLSTDAEVEKNPDGYVATVTTCYEVHRKSLARKAGSVEGDSWKRGEDLRTDSDGKAIKPGTTMGDRVTMHRGLAQNGSWKLDGINVDVDVDCSDRG